MERFNLISSELCDDPRTFDEFYPTFLVASRRYSHIGKVIDADFFEELPEEEKDYIFPLYVLEHGIVHISMSSFHDKWDSGQIGWVYADPTFRTNVDKPEEACREAVKEMDAWLSGDVWEIEDKAEGEYYGPIYGYDNALAELNDMARLHGNTYDPEPVKLYTRDEVLALLNMPHEEAIRQVA